MITVMRLLGSGGLGKLFTKAKSPAEILEAACCIAGKLVKVPRSLNLAGLIEARSCKTPKVGTESCTTGSRKRKLGTTLLRTPRILDVTLPRPLPPGTAMFFAIEPTRYARSGGTPGVSQHIYTRLRDQEHTGNAAQRQSADADARNTRGKGWQIGALLAFGELRDAALEEVGQITLDKAANGQGLTEKGHRILLQKTEESGDDGDGKGTNGICSRDLESVS
jgi:hypothetical protein